MPAVLQIENYASMLSARRSILEPLGYEVISVLGPSEAINPGLLRKQIGAIVIGHGIPWHERQELVAHFRDYLPMAPIVCLLRNSDLGFTGADYNCPGDNPPLWIRTVVGAMAEGRKRVPANGSAIVRVV